MVKLNTPFSKSKIWHHDDGTEFVQIHDNNCFYVCDLFKDDANEILDHINNYEQLKSKLQEREWISVEDRLPEPETMVLGIVSGYDGILTLERRWETCNQLIEGYFKDFLYWDWVDNDGQDFEGLVSHWMPLPPPPKQGENNEKFSN